MTRVWVHEDLLSAFEVSGELIWTTEDHPFWNATERIFRRADAIRTGDQVLAADRALVTATGLNPARTRVGLAYNLTVDEIHTYHVGRVGIVVHNECSDEAWDIATHAFDKHGAEMGFENIDEMGDYVDSVMSQGAGHLRDDGSRFWVDQSRSAIVFRGPSAAVPGTVYRPDNFARAVQRELDRVVNE